MSNRTKSRVFIGSSSAGLEIARALRDCIGDRAIVTVWNEDKNVGVLGRTLIDTLELGIHKYDFGIFLLKGDDILISKEQVHTAARDNVLFELGMFAGWFGITRTFMVYDNEANVKIPSDLAGITFAPYQQHPSGWKSALSPAADKICEAIERQGALSETTEERLRAAVWNTRRAWALFTAQSHLINEMSEQIRLWSSRIDKWKAGHFICE